MPIYRLHDIPTNGPDATGDNSFFLGPQMTSTFMAGDGPLSSIIPAHLHSQTDPSVRAGSP